MFVKEEILKNPKRAVSAEERNFNEESGDEKRSNYGEEIDKDTRDCEEAQDFLIREGTAEDDQRLVGVAEEVRGIAREKGG